MSKSIGNIINVDDILKRWDAEVIRLFYAYTHYRNPPDFTDRTLSNARRSLERIYRLKERLEELSKKSASKKFTSTEEEYLKVIENFRRRFESAMDDDFNTPKAIGTIFEFVSKTNKLLEQNEYHPEICKKALDTLVELCNILTLLQDIKEEKIDVKPLLPLIEKYTSEKPPSSGEEAMDLLLKVREDARSRGDWSRADAIREDLRNIGIEVEDTDRGPRWRKKRVP
jgi:cysteinyl-tRNA synthetase